MKKLFKILILVLVAVCCAAGLFACDSGSDKDKKTGLQYKMYDGDDGYTVYGYVKEGDETELDIGSFNKDGVVIKRIKKGAFKDNDNLVKIIVPDTVETIDGGAFENMKALKEITLPFIGKTAVADVSGINSAPDDKAADKSTGSEKNFGYIFGTEEYDGGVAVTQNYDSSNTSTYYLPETLRTVNVSPKAGSEYGIPMYAFSGNAWVNKVVLSADVKEIGVAAFKDNVYAETIDFGGVKTIYEDAFNGAKNIAAVDITGLTEIPGACFKNCTKLNSVVVSDDLDKIGANAFYGCTAITEISGINGSDNYWAVGSHNGIALNPTNVKNENYSVCTWYRLH